MTDVVLEMPPFRGPGGGYAKLVSEIDETQRHSRAFVGEYVNLCGVSLLKVPVGAFLLLVHISMVKAPAHIQVRERPGPEAGMMPRASGAQLFTATEAGWKELARADGPDWSLRMQPDAKKLIGAALVPKDRNPRLLNVTDAELLAEINRRCLDVFEKR